MDDASTKEVGARHRHGGGQEAQDEDGQTEENGAGNRSRRERKTYWKSMGRRGPCKVRIAAGPGSYSSTVTAALRRFINMSETMNSI